MGKRLGVSSVLLAVVAAIGFGSAPVTAQPGAAPAHLERAVLAGGCFWGMEAVFSSLKGVTNVVSGYTGGSKATATYEIVSTGATGHAESVDITYDPAQISYAQLLQIYFRVAHDPTQLNRQHADQGTQYRSSIFYVNDAQKRVAETTIRDLTAAKVFPDPIVTKVVPLTTFYPAESYHQHFVARNPTYPYVVFVDMPILKQLRERYPAMVKAHG